MRYAIISDIHSNLEALQTFLEEADRLGIEEIICLGDVVGYNANPNECVDLVRERKMRCIMGNHDSRAAGIESVDDFNLMAAYSIEWTRSVLTDENREFLANLPRTMLVDDRFLAMHGWIDDTDKYIFGGADAIENFRMLKESYDTNLCFFGHTHVGISYINTSDTVELSADNTLKIYKKYHYLVNPGALGQSRDRDPRGSYVIYDTKTNTVTYRRVDYDIQATVDKIIAAGLSPRLAERLKLGW